MYQQHTLEMILNQTIESYRDKFKDNPMTNINRLAELKKELPLESVNDLITIFSLQNKYKKKLVISEQWILTDKNAQQASSYPMAVFHASLFSGFKVIGDLCCGIGMDLAILAKNKQRVYAVDIDDHIINYCRYNMNIAGMTNIIFQNIRAEDFKEQCEAVFIDPDRRIDGKRKLSPCDLSPSLTDILKHPHLPENKAIKLSPAMDYEDIEEFKQGTLYFVSESGELKEILFCTGSLSLKEYPKICTLLPEGITFVPEADKTEIPVSEIGKYLFEPDAAIIRAHLVEDIACHLQLTKIDKHLALLTSDTVRETPWGKWFEVSQILPFSLKELQIYIKSHQIGIMDIKTRGYSETVETFRKKIKLKGKNHCILFILRIGKKHAMVIASTKKNG